MGPGGARPRDVLASPAREVPRGGVAARSAAAALVLAASLLGFAGLRVSAEGAASTPLQVGLAPAATGAAQGGAAGVGSGSVETAPLGPAAADDGEDADDDRGYYRPQPGEVVGDRDPAEGELGGADGGLPDTFGGLPAVSVAADYELALETSSARVRLPGSDLDATVRLTSNGPSNWLVTSFRVQAAAPAVSLQLPVAPVTGTDCAIGNDYHGHSGFTCTIHLHVRPSLPEGTDVGLDGVVVSVELLQDNGERVKLVAAKPLRVERPVPLLAVSMAGDVGHLPETGGLVRTTVTVRNAGEDTATVQGLTEVVPGAPEGPVDLWTVPGSTCGPIVLTPGGSWTCSYQRWYVGEANVALERTVTAEGRIADGTQRSSSAHAAEMFDDVVPSASFDVDATAALRARDGSTASLAVQLIPQTAEAVFVEQVGASVNGATVAGAADGCGLPQLVAVSSSLRCDVSVPLQPGVPSTVRVDLTYRDNEGNWATVTDSLVVQIASAGSVPVEGDGPPPPGQAAPPPAVAPAPRPVSAVVLPITGGAAERGVQGLAIVGLGLMCSAAAAALGRPPARRAAPR